MDIEQLISDGYKIRNAEIIYADLRVGERGCLTFYITLEIGDRCGICNRYSSEVTWANEKKFNGEYIRRIMDAAGVSRFSSLQGSYARVAKDNEGRIAFIGNIIEDKWVGIEDFD